MDRRQQASNASSFRVSFRGFLAAFCKSPIIFFTATPPPFFLHPRIIQWPSVLVKMSGADPGGNRFAVVSEFDTFVRSAIRVPVLFFFAAAVGTSRIRMNSPVSHFSRRPTLNPTLTVFSQQLCGIKQADVDGAPVVQTAVQKWLVWLRSFHLVAEDGSPTNNDIRWAVCTWCASTGS